MVRIAENAEQDDLGGGLKQTTIYSRKIYVNDGSDFVRFIQTDLVDDDKRIQLPAGNWIESKRTQARFLIGNGPDTRFNMDVKIESASPPPNYKLDSEGVTITSTDFFAAQWAYSHKIGPTTFLDVLLIDVQDSNFQFIFTAPEADTFRLHLQITPVIGGVISSAFMRNKNNLIYGVVWELAGAKLYYTFSGMSVDINETDTELLGNTLFLYSNDFVLNQGEGFTLG